MATATGVDLGTAKNMRPAAALDLLVLTFNCAAKRVNVPVFAHHVQDAFGRNATGLPEVVVFSLQEIAPMSYAFIGDYFLNEYVARFDEAVNMAASSYLGQPLPGNDQPADLAKPYTMIRAKNVGYTAILLFARDPSRIGYVEEAEVGFGAAEMGNKGAVGLRTLYHDGDAASTELTFVATHLAAMEWNLLRRNANWGAIMRGLTFENPEAVLSNMRSEAAARGEAGSSESGGAESVGLLQGERRSEDLELRQRFHDLSVFKPSSHLFVAGDLNYRISTASPNAGSAFPSLDPDSENYYPSFLDRDQLTRERQEGRTFHGMTEHQVRFPPTYKYVTTPRPAGSAEEEAEDLGAPVPWKFAPHRYPAWTDRILFLETPPWVSSKMEVHAYDALPVMRTSDHRPVFLRVGVPLVSPSDLVPPTAITEAGSPGNGQIVDPRIRLPVEIDPEAWERRLAARRWELITGWSLFLWKTKQGAYILATLLVAAATSYWLFRAA